MTDTPTTSTRIEYTQAHRVIPAHVTMPDGAELGNVHDEPCLVTVHSNGTVSIHRWLAPANMIVTVLESHLTAHPNPSYPSVIDCEAGRILVNPGPGCACGNPLKRHYPVMPDV